MSSSNESESPSEGTPKPEIPAESIDTASPPDPTARLWPWAVGAGLIAGLAAWMVGEGLLIVNRERLAPPADPFPRAEVLLALIEVEKSVATQTFIALGALLGLALGIAGGGTRRSVAAAGSAGLAGLILGGAAAGAAAFGLLKFYYTDHDPLSDDLLLPLLTHAGVAAAIGVAGGAALGIGLGSRIGRTIVGGLIGAIGGAVLYEIVGALAFPMGQTSDPVAGAMAPRLLFHLGLATLAAAGAVWVAQAPTRRPKPAPPAV